MILASIPLLLLLRSRRDLRARERRFRRLADALPQFVWVIDPKGRPEFFNSRWREFALRAGGGGETFADWGRFLHPDDVGPVSEAWKESLERRSPYEIEHRLRDPRDGTYRWYLGRAIPLLDDDGAVETWVGTCTDIDEQKRAQERLRDMSRELEARVAAKTASLSASERFLDSIIEHYPGTLYVKDAHDLRIVRCNRGALEMTGFVRENVINRTEHDLFPKELADRFLAEDLEVLAGRLPYVVREEQVPTHQGMKAVRLRKVAIRDESGRPMFLLGIAEDLQDFRRAEEERRRMLQEEIVIREREMAARRSTFLADASSRLLFSLNARDAIQRLADYVTQEFSDWCTVAVLDETGRMERVASAHCEPERVSKILRLADLYVNDPEARQALVFRTGKTLRRECLTDEDILRHTSCAERIALMRALDIRSILIVPIRVRERVIGSITFGAGNDERRFDEEDQRVAEELGRRAGMAIENAELYRKAQEAIHNRDEFLSAASHELKTPLTSLRIQLETNARLLRNLPSETLPQERVQRSIRVTNQQLDRLAALVEDMLDIARIQGGRLAIRPASVDLAEVVTETCERLEAQLGGAGCELRLDLPRAFPAVCDPFRIEQVIANLLTNAAKYAPGAPVEVRLSEEGDSAKLEVRDHGPGVPEEFLGRIFHRYERFAPGAGKGLGLGLYISRYIIEQHGGRISVRNHPGGGAVFTLEFPRSGADAGLAAAKA